MRDIFELEGVLQELLAGETTPIKPGSIVFVGKRVPHTFLDYPDGLTLLVVFAPARGSGAG